MDEKRQAPRLEISRDFKSADEFIREYAMNLSLGGCFVRSADVAPVGTEVTRVVEPGGCRPPDVGAIFTSLTDESRDVLVRLFLREKKPVLCDEETPPAAGC